MSSSATAAPPLRSLAQLDPWALGMLSPCSGDTLLLSGSLAWSARRWANADPTLALTLFDPCETRLAEARVVFGDAPGSVRYLHGDVASLQEELGHVDRIGLSDTVLGPGMGAVLWVELADLLMRGGRLVIQVPAVGDSKGLSRALEAPGTAASSDPLSMTPENARCQLSAAGLIVEFCETVRQPLHVSVDEVAAVPPADNVEHRFIRVLARRPDRDDGSSPCGWNGGDDITSPDNDGEMESCAPDS